MILRWAMHSLGFRVHQSLENDCTTKSQNETNSLLLSSLGNEMSKSAVITTMSW